MSLVSDLFLRDKSRIKKLHNKREIITLPKIDKNQQCVNTLYKTESIWH